MERISAIIVDDEQDAINSLKTLLKDFDDIRIVGEAMNVKDSIEIFNTSNPDLMFLDIDLGNNTTGFDLLEKINYKENVYVIFVTAYDQYAIKAFNYSALDYILKPIDPDRLEQALSKYRQQKSSGNIEVNIKKLLNYVKSDKIKFNTRTGFIYLTLDEIMYCKADRDYTEIHLIDKHKELVTINLSNVRYKINNPNFIKIGRSIILNKKYITKADRAKEVCVLKINDYRVELPLSRKLIREVEWYLSKT
ncbi:MAG: response regulator transcription factor [Bacteroidales bacterium]|nr:response regulator transcription factor [Bacteroidales bacterium]